MEFSILVHSAVDIAEPINSEVEDELEFTFVLLKDFSEDYCSETDTEITSKRAKSETEKKLVILRKMIRGNQSITWNLSGEKQEEKIIPFEYLKHLIISAFKGIENFEKGIDITHRNQEGTRKILPSTNLNLFVCEYAKITDYTKGPRRPLLHLYIEPVKAS